MSSRRVLHLTILAVALLCCLAAMQAAGKEPGKGPGERTETGAAAASFVVAMEAPLPRHLEGAYDLRTIGTNQVLLAAGSTGVFRASLAPDGTLHLGKRELRHGTGPGTFYMTYFLGASKDFWAIGAPGYALGWRAWGDPPGLYLAAFDQIMDLDVHGDRLLVLGAQRGEDDSFAPDGAIAHHGTLGADSKGLMPLHYSVTGPGARSIDACAVMLTGAVRFMPDGSAVVAPGVEPGVFLYGKDGRLLRTWQEEEVGFDAGCGLSDEEMYRYGVDLTGRWAWVNQRRVIDEILPMADGPGLVVRSHRQGVTSWRVVHLSSEGPRNYEIPVTGGPLDYLHGDRFGDRWIFLLHSVKLPAELKKRPPNPQRDPRLIVMDLVP